MPPHASIETPVPAVVILHGSGGDWTGRSIYLANRLAKHGIAGFAVDTFVARNLRSTDDYFERLQKASIYTQIIDGFKVRFQNIVDLPFKDLRKLIDEGKKEIGEGLVIIYAINDNKVGLAVGVTKTLESKFDAVKIVRAGSKIIGGKGGGGRVDFAQAGGTLPDKIQESFEDIKKLIN